MNTGILIDPLKSKSNTSSPNRSNLVSSIVKPVTMKNQTLNQPFCQFVNIELLDSMNVIKNKATILIEQPVDQNVLNKNELIKLVCYFFVCFRTRFNFLELFQLKH